MCYGSAQSNIHLHLTLEKLLTYTAILIRNKLKEMYSEIIEHSLYSPDLWGKICLTVFFSAFDLLTWLGETIRKE